jgi:hypothetical protein
VVRLPRIVAVCSLAACNFEPSGATRDAGTHDATTGIDSPDSSIDASTGSGSSGFDDNCVGNGVVHVCFGSGSGDVPMPTTSFTIQGMGDNRNLDTTKVDAADCTILLTQATGSVCLVAVTAVTINGTLHVSGANSLAFASTGAITINGTVDVGGHMMTPGPGGNLAVCTPPTPETLDGGGAGGSFVGVGGNGGSGSAGNGGVPAAGSDVSTITTLRGGCAGGEGANGQAPGGGGGALDLISAAAITIDGNLLAGGGGGAGAGGMNGGGGAGAGGLIVFDSAQGTQIGSNGNINANGGGGGQGQQPGHNGMVGQDSTSALVAAAGGSDTSAGGPGGSGSIGTTGPTAGQSRAASAGGGGGGGSGAVLVWGSFANGSGAISPPAAQR